MYQRVVDDVAKKFGLHVIHVGSTQKGYRSESYPLTLSSGKVVNLIFHKQEAEALKYLATADRAANTLYTAELPVRTRYDARTLVLKTEARTLYIGLYTYLPGTTIPWEAYTKDHIKLLGWAMSDMHALWSEASNGGTRKVSDELEALRLRMDRYFGSDGVQDAMYRKLGVSVDGLRLKRFGRLISLLNTSPLKHMLHMDLVRGNVLFGASDSSSPWRINETALTGIIDFEKATSGSPLFDIARTLAFLYVDCSAKEPDQIIKYFLRSGYNRRGRAHYNPAEMIGGVSQRDILSGLIAFFLLHDFYKFLRHTPYESLHTNHHYVRTRNILAGYDMVRYL